MNSLTLLDSFLSRSLTATPRNPSPQDTPPATPHHGRRRPHSTTPSEEKSALLAEGDEAAQEGDEDGRHAASSSSASSSSSRLPRRNSDHVLSTSRNRLKRSQRFALGFGMTAAVDDSSVGKKREQNGEGAGGAASDEVEAMEEEGDDNERPSHGKSFSEGGRLRRSGSSPASRHMSDNGDSHPPPSWSSSLWGLSSWLDPSNGKSQSDYAPGESLGDEEEEEKERRRRRKERRRARRAKREAEAQAQAQGQGQEQNGQAAAAAVGAAEDGTERRNGEADDGDESDGSIGTSGSSSTSGSSQGGGALVRRPSALELSGRLLFANRIFTPFHHPSLTASVPNLPSEVAATAGLGGMEDVQTVDFEGGESDIEADDAGEGEQEVTAAASGPASTSTSTSTGVKEVTPPLTPGRQPDLRLKRHATISTPTAESQGSKRRRPDRDDYFGPRAVERERKRIQAEEGSSEEERGRESREVSAQLKAAEGQRMSVDQDEQQGAPPPYEEAAAPAATSQTTDAKQPEQPPSPRKLSLARRILICLRRAILAILLAPLDAITFIFSTGKGKGKLIAVSVGTPSPAALSQPTAGASGTKPSLKFSGDVNEKQQRGERRRKPTPNPGKRPDETPDDVVTEDQAREKAETQIVEKMDEAKSDSPPPSPPTTLQTRASRLLPNPHSVDPMLVHEPKAKKVTGELPERSQSFTSLRPQAVPPTVPRTAAVIHHTPKILVLDLDETLIHSTSRSPTWTALRNQHSSKAEAAARSAVSTGGSLLGLDGLGGLLGLTGGGGNKGGGRSVRPHMVEVVLDGRSVIYHVYKRPYVDVFLRKVAAWYHVVIFTASVQEYADPVIDWLDQGRGLIAGRLFRDACTYKNGSYLKELSIVDTDLSRVCLVDNSPASYHLNPANGIPVEGWTHDPSDEALLDLLPILDSLRFAQDVRHVLGIRITDAQQGGAK